MHDRATNKAAGSPILVTGGTGTLGELVVDRLLRSGNQVRVLSRRPQQAIDGVELFAGDLSTGEGVEEAAAGVGTIVHAAGSAKGDALKARNLISAASLVGRPHVVYISVVGADRIPIVSGLDRAMYGYFGEKFAAERLLAESGLPHTILRATQFHQLLHTVVEQLVKLPLMPALAGVRFQPIDAGEVADRLVSLTQGDASGVVPEVGGPKIYTMAELPRAYLDATGRRRFIVPLWQPGQAARAFRQGANLTPDQNVGELNWEEFLTEQLGLKRGPDPSLARAA